MTGPGASAKGPRSLQKTAQVWHKDQEGNQVFDSPVETGAKLDSRQGKVEGFRGTCGLVSCENILRMAGLQATEADIVSYAKGAKSEESGKYLCSSGSPFAADNGSTSVEARNEILKHYGVEAVALPCDVDSIAKNVEEGRGVIISVHAHQLYYGYSDGGDNHAVCVTSVKRDANGQLLGFYLCDSNDRPAEFYYSSELERALTGRDMNVTTSILR